MPRAARKRLGSSLSGTALHEYIEEKRKEDERVDQEEAKAKLNQ